MSDEIARIVFKVTSDGLISGKLDLKHLREEAEKVPGALEDVEKQTHKLSSGFKVFGRDLSRYITLPLTIAGTAATKFSMDLTKGMGMIQTMVPASGSRIYELQEAVREMSIVSGQSFDNITEGMYQVLSSFQDGEHAVGIFNTAVKASIAGGATVAEAVALLSSVTKAYGDTSDNAIKKVSGLSFETLRLGQTTYPALANAMQIVTDRSEYLGVSQEEMFTVFATLTGVIGDASKVATSFRAALTALDAPTDAMVGLFHELGVESGKQLIAQYGLVESFVKIDEAVQKTGRPIRDYISRIEGVGVVQRLASTQNAKYLSDLEALKHSLGADDVAFENVTEGIDKFGYQVRVQQQRLKVLYGIIGENLVPMFAKLLTQLNDALEVFIKLPKPIQELGISVGILAAALGPLSIVIGSVLRAFELMASLKTAAWFASLSTTLSGLLPVIAGMSVALFVVGLAFQKSLEKQKEQEKILTDIQDRYYKLNGYIDKNTDVTQVNVKMNRELVEQYPELSGQIDKYTTTIEEAVDAVEKLSKIETARALQREVDGLRQMQVEVAKLELGAMDYQSKISAANKAGRTVEAEALTGGLKAHREFQAKLLENYYAFFEKTNARAGQFGYELEESLNLYKIFIDAGEDAAKAFADGLGGGGKGNIKTWQEWFEEITGVVKERFGKSGYLAGKLFGNSFQEGLDLDNILRGQAGMEFKFFNADDLKSQQEEIQKALAMLVNIPENKIDEIFKLAGYNADETDNAVQKLIDRLKLLEETIPVQTMQDIVEEVDKNNKEIYALEHFYKDLGKEVDYTSSKVQVLEAALKQLVLLQATLRAAGKYESLEELQRAIDNILEALGKLDSEEKTPLKSLSGVIREAINDFGKLLGIEEEMLPIIDGIGKALGDAFESATINTMAESFRSLGMAFNSSGDALRNLTDALAQQARVLLDMMPTLFISAGLQAMINGNWGLGLALLAMGASSAVVSGYVQSRIDEESDKNAHGNVYGSSGIYSFAKGSPFTNSIVTSPTYFPFAKGTGLMGEAGPEAIMPLVRTEGGDLGVKSVGGSANVTVNISNYSGAEVETREKQTPNGRELEVIVGSIVKKQWSQGEYNGVARSTYGLRPVGVR